MALPGIYTKEEQQMLEEWKEVERDVGWLGDNPIPGKTPFPVFNRVATEDLIRKRAISIDDPNPLWSDEKYARQTRWGSIIAPPFFPVVITFQGWRNYRLIPPEVGIGRIKFPAAPRKPNREGWGVFPHWEFFKPIRPGDSFRVWCGPNKTEDKTNPDGKGPHTFFLDDQLKYFNQKGELVAIKHKKSLFEIVSIAEAEKEPWLITPGPKKPEYKYTKEEIDYIDRIRENEIIRGAKIRWWEDVKVGEDLQPITNGPITPGTEAKNQIGLSKPTFGSRGKQGAPSADKQIQFETPLRDPETGIIHDSGHLTDRNAHLLGHTQGISGLDVWEAQLGRLVTNWMGDDGFLKRSAWDQLDFDVLGDTTICKGKVIRKYVQNDGEHVVDIACWMENMRGYITKAGTATVGILSRESVNEDLLRY